MKHQARDPDHPTPSLLTVRRAGERRVLWVGLALSALLHVILIALASAWLEPGPRTPDARVPLIVEPPRGMRAVELTPVASTEVAEPAPPEEEEEEEEEEPEEDAPPRVVASADAPDAERAPADTLTAADRLAPRVVDPRLYEPMILVPREPTFAEVEARVAAAIELLSDSALSETERRLRALDWTVKDAEGGKWGVSPGFIHLGKVSIPLPIQFVSVQSWESGQSEWYELEAQLDRQLFVESFEARVRAIRERRDRERREGNH